MNEKEFYGIETQISGPDREYVLWCIRHDIHKFYTWRKWIAKRDAALQLDRYECQHCKRRGRYTKATTVHHVNPLRQYPMLALSMYYVDVDGNSHRQLISLCRDCHERAHNRVLGYNALTEEKW